MKKGTEEAILYPLFPGKGFLEKEPENGYRYYTFTQLHIVEAIVLCRNLNIPLACFRDFIDRPKGTLRYDKLVQEGIEKAEKQIKMLQKKIQFLRLVENDYHRSEYTLHRNHPVSCLSFPHTLAHPL
ncbi:hypothetical protein [Dialister sp.]|uniref:hypothetical protein n=1 Tax=Dialister sp. TaxID=1955814 RepID=UPI003F0965FD